MNPFRTPFLRENWAELVSAWTRKSPVLFNSDGSHNRGCSPAGYFWNGYEAVPMNWDRASKQTAAYAFYRAGQHCADLAKRGSA